jgi:hypothetical protein
MAAFKYTLKINQGETLNQQVVWKVGSTPAPVDLTGCSARMQVRSAVNSPTVLLELSTANGGLVLGGSLGTITFVMNAAATTALTWTQGVYDLEITFADGTVRRLMSGNVQVSPEVTR